MAMNLTDDQRKIIDEHVRLFGVAYAVDGVAVDPSRVVRFTERSSSSSDNHPCCACGTVGDDVTFGPDPYAEEIGNDDTPVWECENCRHESAQDI